jgi:methylated-DNA-[protein]-cysteine S-methyltransferase
MSAEAPLPDLTDAFAAAGLIDVAYTVEESPVGPLLLAGSEQGLLRVGFLDDPAADLNRGLEVLATRVSPRVIRAPGRLDPVRRQLEEYFGGRRQRFSLALDRRLMRPGFGGRVLAATAKIPYGATSTYLGVAGAAGSPRGYRAAGSALGANPLPIVIPCHRVLASGGGMGGYAGGAERKRHLLAIEAGIAGEG